MTLPAAPQFVGRASELATLTARFEQAARGHGGVALIAGEPGIGKTSLAHAFTAQAQQRGALVLWGRCYEGDWSPPFAPWVEAFGGFVRTAPPERVRLGPAIVSQIRLPIGRPLVTVRAVGQLGE